jgi:hypothetical protein
MKKNIFVKLICLSVIILLIGVSYSSAVSSVEKTSIYKCKKQENINCQKISDVYLNKIKKIEYRLDLYKKILNFFSINDQVLQTKFEKLSYKITNLKDIDDNTPICDFLENIYLYVKDIVYYIRDIYIGYQQDEPLRAFVINILAIPFAEAWLLVYVTGHEFNCWDDPF